ncbi:hypothetical protein GRX03_02975 [Halovenus sp. WSH3]|uniref:Uncharacterized protein n=1 Tax=Halovenus carboxidivorans TaxID=2692199 RepID=A0A6B0T5H2_9EURY|nr:DUF5797 family protein [Halovenus carboxidivorans]MXR50572.1 hypothetical protein [Halovenus carboxidivorans]
MSLSEEARERLADIVELQPTKNAELQERWGLAGGSEVHQYLESELGEYYYRDENSMICATPEAEELVGDGDGGTGERSVAGTELQRRIVGVLPGPDDEPQSVVATLHDVEATGAEPSVDDVRSALHTLTDKGLVERVRETVPTFRLAIERERIVIETGEN